MNQYGGVGPWNFLGVYSSLIDDRYVGGGHIASGTCIIITLLCSAER